MVDSTTACDRGRAPAKRIKDAGRSLCRWAKASPRTPIRAVCRVCHPGVRCRGINHLARLGELLRAGEDGVGHRLGELAGEGVLLARVEAAEQGPAAAQLRLGAVAEARLWARGGDADRPRRAQEPVPAERAERDDDAGSVEQVELPLQVG